MISMPTSIQELETSLRAFYGTAFEQKYAEVLKESKTPLGALNALNNITEENVTLEGAYVGLSTKKNRSGQTQSAWFRVLDKNGKMRRIYLHSLSFAEKLPDAPPILSGVRWANLSKTMIVSKDSSVYKTKDTTSMTVDNSIEYDLVELTTFTRAVEKKKSLRKDERDPYFTVLGNIVNVRIGEDKERDRKWVTAFIEDTEGTQIGCNVISNLEDIFGSQNWLEDYNEVSQNLYNMPVLVNGRVFMFEKSDGSEGVSFVVKGGGWIADMSHLPKNIQQKLEKLVFQ